MAKKDRKDKEKSGGKGLIIIVIILLLVIIIGGVAAFFIITKTMNSDEPKKIIEEVLVLDETVVNIKDPSMKRYAKFSLAITYDSKDKDVLDDINENLYKIKDGIISIFQDKTIDDIESNEGIESIKSEIKVKIDSILEDNAVISVYFTNLLVH